MRTLRVAAGLCVLLGFQVARAQPDGDESGFEFGLVGGAHRFDSSAPTVALGSPEGDGPVPYSSVLLGLRLGYRLIPLVGLEGEALVVPSGEKLASGGSGDNLLVYGARAQIVLRPVRGRFEPFLLAGAGWMGTYGDGERTDEIRNDVDVAGHWGGGFEYAFSPAVRLRLDARHVMLPSRRVPVDGTIAHDLEVLAGLSFRPRAAARFPMPIESDPERVMALTRDQDGDVILDTRDQCPGEAEDFDGVNDTDGCPDLDDDGDGIKFPVDRCDDEPETVNGVADEDGCPERDVDGDRILEPLDKCPQMAEDRDGFEDDDGCVDPDNDGDGIVDLKDRCPSEKETSNGYLDGDGCADELPPEVTRFAGILSIQFKRNSDKIVKPASFKVLATLADMMKAVPDIRVEISAHTLLKGKRQKNLDLSQRRADAVRGYLVGKGIEAKRITAVGHGPDKPIAPKKSRKNERLELRVIAE